MEAPLAKLKTIEVAFLVLRTKGLLHTSNSNLFTLQQPYRGELKSAKVVFVPAGGIFQTCVSSPGMTVFLVDINMDESELAFLTVIQVS